MPRRKGDDVEALILLNHDESGPRYWAGVVGINVRLYRRDLGLSQSRLSVRLHQTGWLTNQKTVSAMESNARMSGRTTNGHVTMSVDRLMTLATVLGVTPAQLMDDRWQRRVRATLTS